MPARKKETINLLPEKGFASTTTGRILAWILSTFRIIVIVTEILVMIAFLSRFWLDAQNTDLGEEIDQKKAVLIASKDFETDFRGTQKRLEIYTQLTSAQKRATNTLKKITELLPLDVFLTTVNVEENTWTISGKTPSEKSIQQFLVNLNSIEGVNKTSIDSVGTDEDDPSALLFKLSMELDNGKDQTNE
jgi:Tfp pilus assembly protein PilN